MFHKKCIKNNDTNHVLPYPLVPARSKSWLREISDWLFLMIRSRAGLPSANLGRDIDAPRLSSVSLPFFFFFKRSEKKNKYFQNWILRLQINKFKCHFLRRKENSVAVDGLQIMLQGVTFNKELKNILNSLNRLKWGSCHGYFLTQVMNSIHTKFLDFVTE